MLFFFLLLGQVLGNEIGSVHTNRCSRCSELNECSIINGKQLSDRILGYTRDESKQLSEQGVCLDYDEKAKRVYLFGPEYQFKDTPECRTLVNNYNCLAWGSKDNPCPDAPLPPCRSLCVEVADKCVFMHLYRYYLDNVCARINCEYLAEQNCVPGELEKDIANDRCTLHRYKPPRGLLSVAPRLSSFLTWFQYTILIMSVIW